MHHVLADPDLLQILLAGVVVVRVHDHSRVRQPALPVKSEQLPQVFIMVVRVAPAEVVHIPPQDRMRQRIPGRMHLPRAEDELLRALGRGDRVHHHADIPGARVLHSDRNTQSARHQPVLLILHAPRADRHIAQQVREVAVVGGIKHLVRAAESGLPQDPRMHLPDGDDARQQVLFPVHVRLVQHSLVADAPGPRLVGIDPRDNHQPFLHLPGQLRQAVHVVQDRVLPVRRARADDQQEAVVLPCQDLPDLPVAVRLPLLQFGRYRIVSHQLLRLRHPPDKLHLHVLSISSFRIKRLISI